MANKNSKEKEAETIFDNIMASIYEIDVDSEYTQKSQKEQYEAMNKDLKVREIGSQVRVPLKNIFKQKAYTDFWVVVKVDLIMADNQVQPKGNYFNS